MIHCKLDEILGHCYGLESETHDNLECPFCRIYNQGYEDGYNEGRNGMIEWFGKGE